MENGYSYVTSGWFHQFVTTSWAAAIYESSLRCGSRLDMENVYAEILANLGDQRKALCDGEAMDRERMDWCRRTAARALRELALAQPTVDPCEASALMRLAAASRSVPVRDHASLAQP